MCDLLEERGATPDELMAALLHDAAEAYLGDLPHPLKHRSELGAAFRVAEKRLEAVTGTTIPDGAPFSGYEMHIGETSGLDASRRAFARLANGRPDGAVSADGRVVGTYVHGLFSDDRQRARWLQLLGAETSDLAYEALVDDILALYSCEPTIKRVERYTPDCV